MALLVPAGLFAKSLLNVSRVELGLKTDHLVTFVAAPDRSTATTRPRTRPLFEQLEEQLAALPGVTERRRSRWCRCSRATTGTTASTVEGFEAGPDTNTSAAYNSVGPGFFTTMGMPLIAGPRVHAPPTARARRRWSIVNQAFTRKFNLGDDAVGKRMTAVAGDGPLDMEIVGVVQDAKYSDVKRAIVAQYFTPYRQDEQLGFGYFYVRTALPPEQLLTAVPGVVKALDPNLPVDDLKTMERQIRENVFLDRMISVLSTAFAAAGDAAGGGRALRRAGLHRGAAHARVRAADGARRRRRLACAAWCCGRWR